VYIVYSICMRNICAAQRSESDLCKMARWEKHLLGAMKDEQFLAPNDELKTLLREGVPPQFRSQIWKAYVQTVFLCHYLRQVGFVMLVC